MATDPQITVRLPNDAKQAFDDYARANGLEGSQLAKLLIIREMRVRRLWRLKGRGRAPKAAARAQRRDPKPGTITARLSSAADVDEFDRYVASCDLIRQTAGAWLLTSELTERWLEKSLSRK